MGESYDVSVGVVSDQPFELVGGVHQPGPGVLGLLVGLSELVEGVQEARG
ncbi:MAG: hypothetical protein M3P89_00250 [Actinomycetota bacterium]|nr:hypothetical protein [Actinomycetota bacterium]